MREKRSTSAESTVEAGGMAEVSLMVTLDPYGVAGVYTPLSGRGLPLRVNSWRALF
jgi:hypothetical protein